MFKKPAAMKDDDVDADEEDAPIDLSKVRKRVYSAAYHAEEKKWLNKGKSENVAKMKGRAAAQRAVQAWLRSL